MTNKKFYSLLLVGALVLIPNSVLAESGSSSASYQTPGDSYINSMNKAYRQPAGASRSVTMKSTNSPQASPTLSSSSQNSGNFHRPGAFQYRKGYQNRTKCRKVKKNRPGLPGHHDNPSTSVPELDASVSQSALALLIGGVLVFRARRRRNI